MPNTPVSASKPGKNCSSSSCAGRTLEGVDYPNRTPISEGLTRPSCLPVDGVAAASSHAELVQLQRSGDGRGAARDDDLAPVFVSLGRIPGETTILDFRRLLEKHELAAGILGLVDGYLDDRGLSLRQASIVDAPLIHARSSTKNKEGKRAPEMHQTKKGNQYYFGANAHIGVDDESVLVRSVVVTATNVADIAQVDKLLHVA